MSRVGWVGAAVMVVLIAAGSWLFFQAGSPAPGESPKAPTKSPTAAPAPMPAPMVRAPSAAAQASARPDAPAPVAADAPPAPAQPAAAVGSRSAAGGKGVPLGQARLAVQKSPHDSRAWQTLAQAHHQVGDVRIALAAVRRAAALDRKWAGSPEGRSMLKQYAHDARHPGPPRSGH